MSRQVPKEVFVRWQEYEDDEPSLSAEPTAQEHADLEENRIVGRYELVETLEVGVRIDIKKAKR